MREEMTTLGESCQFFNGKAHEKDIDAEGKYVVVNSKFISQEGRVLKFTGKQMFPLFTNDIVMVMSDVPNGKALAKCYIIEENDKYSLNQRICAIRTTEFNIRFLFYQLNRHPFLLAFNNGENQSNLRKGDILNCPLWKPKIEIQEKIVELLDEALERIEQAKENITLNIQNTKELFQSKLNEIFTKSKIGWEEKTLAELSLDLLQGINTATDKTKFTLKGIPILQAKEIGDEKLNLSKCKFISIEDFSNVKERYKANHNDILLNNIGSSLGRCIEVKWDFDFTFAWNIMRIIPNEKLIIPTYLKYGIQSPNFQKSIWAKTKGVGMPFISKKDISKLTLSFPNKEQQLELIPDLDLLYSHSKLNEVKYIQKFELLEELEKSILEKAFTGELTKKAVAV